MAKLVVRASYSLFGRITGDAGKAFSFTARTKAGELATVTLTPGDKDFNSRCEYELSEGLFNRISNDDAEFNKWPDEEIDEFARMTSSLSEATRKVIDTLKFYLHQDAIGDRYFGVRRWHWSTDNQEWRHLRTMGTVVAFEIHARPLEDATAQAVQRVIDSGRNRLTGLLHLHRASNAQQARYAWIDATIAAELAIKEFLTIRVPDVQVILQYCPSPPIGKLYGEILENYVGQRSPVLKELVRGAERRNLLVHRPEEIKIGHQESNDYVEHVTLAIYHLMHLLHPEDEIIGELFKRMLWVYKRLQADSKRKAN